MRAKKAFLFLATIGILSMAAFLHPADASAQAKQVVKKDAKKARQAAEKGRTAFGKRDYRIALENYTQAVQLDPDNPDNHFWKGVAHFQLNEHSSALPELELALTKGYKDQVTLYGFRW